MWPVAAASTTTRSHAARPSNDSRTSQQILPMVRISFTPGAAVATKSNTLASGPTRPGNGSLRLRRRYSWSDASVSMAMAQRAGKTISGRKPTGRRSKKAAMSPRPSADTRSTFRPCWAARRAMAAETVVLPTPPFPVKKRSRRPRRSGVEATALISYPPNPTRFVWSSSATSM